MSKSPSDIIIEVVGKLDLFSGVPASLVRAVLAACALIVGGAVIASGDSLRRRKG